MQRSVRVNAFGATRRRIPDISMHPTRPFTLETPEDSGDDISFPTLDSPPTGPSRGDLGPCLYFGPRGERCSRRAVRDGFCAVHQPGATPLKSATPAAKIIAAIAALIGMLTPFISDIVRAILRWLHTH